MSGQRWWAMLAADVGPLWMSVIMPTLANVGFQCCPDICQRQADVAPTYICYQGYEISSVEILKEQQISHERDEIW